MNSPLPLSLPLSATLDTKMKAYCKELHLFNSAYDLVGADTEDEIFTRHILDSLAASPLLAQTIQKIQAQKEHENSAMAQQPFKIADVGSGGGLPGIPLAAAFPDIQFTLIERMSKRCAFLENCIIILGLKNVEVLQREAEKAPKGAFDLVVFRAFRPLDIPMTKTLLKLLSPWGYLAAYKAKQKKIDEEMLAIKALVPLWTSHELDASFLGAGTEERERHLVLIPNRQSKQGDKLL